MFTSNQILGSDLGCFVGYATDESFRRNAASGGVVNAISKYLLAKGIVQGVVASRLDVSGGELNPCTIIARSSEQLDDCKNSIYLDFNVGAKGIFNGLIKELEETEHRFAVVGLYCHLVQLVNLMKRRSIPRDRLILIGLFCSHAPHRDLAKKVLERQGGDLHRAVAYHTKTGSGYQDGRLYGRSTLEYQDGSVLDFPFIEFTTFKNAWFKTPKKCLVCPDQFAEVADISCGDAWYPEIRKHKYKQTTVIVRSKEARDIALRMVRDKWLELRSVDPNSIVRSQRRVAGVEKASLAARVRLAPLFGMRLPQATGKIRIRDLVHSFFMLGAVRISESPRAMGIILALPTSVVLAFTLLIKVLEQSLLTGLPKGTGVGDFITGYEDATEKAKEVEPNRSANIAE